MVIKPKWIKYLNNPVFTLGGLKLDFTNMKKCLRCLIADDLFDGHDMKGRLNVYMPDATYSLEM